jgi:hypothetical protein
LNVVCGSNPEFLLQRNEALLGREAVGHRADSGLARPELEDGDREGK